MNEEIEKLLKKADNDEVSAQYELGCIFFYGLYGEKTDLKKAYYWFQIAVTNGHTNARIMLSRISDINAINCGTHKNPKKSRFKNLDFCGNHNDVKIGVRTSKRKIEFI